MSTQVELPIAAPAPTSAAPVPGVSRAEWLRLARPARWLSWASLAYMAIEGAVALAAGLVAGSIALVGFGIDSANGPGRVSSAVHGARARRGLRARRRRLPELHQPLRAARQPVLSPLPPHRGCEAPRLPAARDLRRGGRCHATGPRRGRRAPRAELCRYPGGHFDLFEGETVQRVLADEVDWLAGWLDATSEPRQRADARL